MNDAGGMVTKIKELIRTAPFELNFKLITKYKNKECKFNSDPIRHLMKSCDDETRMLIEKIRNKKEEINMVKFGKCCINTNDGVIDRPVREAVRIIETIDSENCYLLEKCTEN